MKVALAYIMEQRRKTVSCMITLRGIDKNQSTPKASNELEVYSYDTSLSRFTRYVHIFIMILP